MVRGVPGTWYQFLLLCSPVLRITRKNTCSSWSSFYSDLVPVASYLFPFISFPVGDEFSIYIITRYFLVRIIPVQAYQFCFCFSLLEPSDTATRGSTAVLLFFCHRGECLGAWWLPAFFIDACRRMARACDTYIYMAMAASGTARCLAVSLSPNLTSCGCT